MILAKLPTDRTTQSEAILAQLRMTQFAGAIVGKAATALEKGDDYDINTELSLFIYHFQTFCNARKLDVIDMIESVELDGDDQWSMFTSAAKHLAFVTAGASSTNHPHVVATALKEVIRWADVRLTKAECGPSQWIFTIEANMAPDTQAVAAKVA